MGRYTSHVERHGHPHWINTIEHQHESRQLDHIFAKRCVKKNPTYIPTDFTYQNELVAQHKAALAFDPIAGEQEKLLNEFQNLDQQNEMLKKAFGKNIVRIQTDNKCLKYEQASKLACEKAHIAYYSRNTKFWYYRKQ